MKIPKIESEDEKISREMAALILTETAALELKGLPPAHEIAKLANGIVLKMLLRIATDAWPIPNAEMAVKIAKFAHEIARIQQGLPTTISQTANKDDVKKMLAEHRQAAEERAREDRGG
jgi:hypothetical protein